MPTPARRCAIYARVSRQKGQDPESQLTAVREFAARSNWTITKEYIDRQSGSTMDRPQLAEMLGAADRKEFDVLLFWSLDRLTRTGIADTLQTLQSLIDCDIEYHSFTQPHIRGSGPTAKLNIAIIATFAELERETMRERTHAGLDRARAQGKILGRPRRIVDVVKIRNLIDAGKTYAEVSNITGVSKATLIRRLITEARI